MIDINLTFRVPSVAAIFTDFLLLLLFLFFIATNLTFFSTFMLPVFLPPTLISIFFSFLLFSPEASDEVFFLSVPHRVYIDIVCGINTRIAVRPHISANGARGIDQPAAEGDGDTGKR